MKIIKIEVDKLPTSCFRDEYYCDCIFLKRYEKQPFFRCSLTNKAATGTKRNRFCPIVERLQSEWIYSEKTDKEKGYGGYCSNCKCDMPIFVEDWKQKYCETKFCPNCGAKMTKGGAE